MSSSSLRGPNYSERGQSKVKVYYICPRCKADGKNDLYFRNANSLGAHLVIVHREEADNVGT